MTTRRQFLQNTTGAFLGALALPGIGSSAPGKPPRKLEAIGLQLYTVRRELQQDFEGTLAKVAAAGYKEVEFAGYFSRPAKEIKAMLARNGLAAPAAHPSGTTLPLAWERAVEAAVTIGHRYLICAFVSPAERRTLDDYKIIASIFNRAGESCKKAGLQFAYHNHDFEFAPLEGKLPYDVLLAETDASLVRMEMDLYWITKGNQDPLSYFEKHPGRFHLVHIKDMDSTPQRGQTEVGRGIIDFRRILAATGGAGTRHFLVEHDNPASALESIQASFDYLHQLDF